MPQEALASFSLHHTSHWAKDLVKRVLAELEGNLLPKAGRTWTTNLWYFYVLALPGKDKSLKHSFVRPIANPSSSILYSHSWSERGLPS